MRTIGFPRGLQLILGIAGIAFGTLGAAMGVTFALTPPPETEPDSVVIVRVLGGILGIFGIAIVVGAVRSMRACVRIGAHQLAVVSTWRTKTVRVTQVRCFVVGSTTGAVPIISFHCLSVELNDGSCLVLRESRNLNGRRSADAVDQANRLLPTHQ